MKEKVDEMLLRLQDKNKMIITTFLIMMVVVGTGVYSLSKYQSIIFWISGMTIVSLLHFVPYLILYYKLCNKMKSKEDVSKHWKKYLIYDIFSSSYGIFLLFFNLIICLTIVIAIESNTSNIFGIMLKNIGIYLIGSVLLLLFTRSQFQKEKQNWWNKGIQSKKIELDKNILHFTYEFPIGGKQSNNLSMFFVIILVAIGANSHMFIRGNNITIFSIFLVICYVFGLLPPAYFWIRYDFIERMEEHEKETGKPWRMVP